MSKKKHKKNEEIKNTSEKINIDNSGDSESEIKGETEASDTGIPGTEKPEISEENDDEAKSSTVKPPRTVAGVSVVDPGTSALEAPVPETKKDKFFNIMNIFGDMVFLNIVFVLTCIPLITIGASFTALYAITLKMVRKEEGNVLLGFLDAFKKNFISATKAWIVVLLYLWLMYIEYVFLLRCEGMAYNVLIMVMGIELLLLSFALPLLFPIIARYENTTANYFKNSIILSFSKISVWFRVYISWIGPAMITLAKPEVLYYGWFVWVFVLCSLLAYSSSLVIRNLFDDMEAAEESRKKQSNEKKAVNENSMNKKVHSADKKDIK